MAAPLRWIFYTLWCSITKHPLFTSGVCLQSIVLILIKRGCLLERQFLPHFLLVDTQVTHIELLLPPPNSHNPIIPHHCHLSWLPLLYCFFSMLLADPSYQISTLRSPLCLLGPSSGVLLCPSVRDLCLKLLFANFANKYFLSFCSQFLFFNFCSKFMFTTFVHIWRSHSLFTTVNSFCSQLLFII